MKNLILAKFALCAFALHPITNLTAQETVLSTSAPAGVVDSGTLLTGKIQLSAIDLNALNSQLMVISNNAVIPPPAIAMATAFRQTMLDAGVDAIYLSVAAKAIPNGGLSLIIPCKDQQTVATMLGGIIRSLPSQLPYEVVSRPGLVIVCPQSMVSYFQGEPTANVDRFDTVISKVNSLSHQIAFGLPTSMRADIIATLPETIESNGMSIPIRQLVSVISDGAIGWELPPGTAAQLRLRCVDEASAQSVAAILSDSLKLLPKDFSSTPKVEGQLVVFDLDQAAVKSWLPTAVTSTMFDARRMQASNNLKQLALAMHDFHATYNFIPGKATVDADGKRLLSWRVAILRFINQADLYAKFKLDEPWDSPNNKPLIAEMPEFFTIPGDQLEVGKTRIRLPVVAGGVWAGEGPPRTFADITDGTSNTIWFVEAPTSAAIEWTRPDDWLLDEQQLKTSFFGDASSIYAAYMDGSIRKIGESTDDEILEALLTMAGGEVIDNDSIKVD